MARNFGAPFKDGNNKPKLPTTNQDTVKAGVAHLMGFTTKNLDAGEVDNWNLGYKNAGSESTRKMWKETTDARNKLNNYSPTEKEINRASKNSKAAATKKRGKFTKNFGKNLVKKVGHYASGALSAGVGLATGLPIATAEVASRVLGNKTGKKGVDRIVKTQKHAADHFKKGNKIKLFKKNK